MCFLTLDPSSINPSIHHLLCLSVHHLNYIYYLLLYNNKNYFDGNLAVWKTPIDGLMDDGLLDFRVHV